MLISERGMCTLYIPDIDGILKREILKKSGSGMDTFTCRYILECDRWQWNGRGRGSGRGTAPEGWEEVGEG